MSYLKALVDSASIAVRYLHKKLDENPLLELVTQEEMDDDEDDTIEYIEQPYLDEYDYTQYRILNIYKENDRYYAKGLSRENYKDTYDFSLDVGDILGYDIICLIADKIEEKYGK